MKCLSERRVENQCGIVNGVVLGLGRPEQKFQISQEADWVTLNHLLTFPA